MMFGIYPFLSFRVSHERCFLFPAHTELDLRVDCCYLLISIASIKGSNIHVPHLLHLSLCLNDSDMYQKLCEEDWVPVG